MMELITQYQYEAAACIARIFLGFLFFFQGYDALFNIGIKKVISTYKYGFNSKGVPGILTTLAALFTTYTEFICGFLLIFGLFEIPALYLLGINLVVAALGFGLNNPLWDMRHVFPRLILLLFLLIIPLEWHNWSLDYLFFKHPVM